MYTKRIVMQGFKSFAKKTEIPFSRGINIILGPNGSGKSNIAEAICFVLGRLSIKSLRAAKAENLIFLGSKTTSPAKEAYVELVLDNSKKIFSVEKEEISIKRIVRRNGQSIYKINNETKTRQEVLNLLSQAGIDPNGFNIILQGEIQNFVTMQPEERRKIIEEVSGISVYETKKEKSLRELEKTEEKLKEINSILRERTNYLNNLEKERQQALKYKKLENQIKVIKGSIINQDFLTKKMDAEKINSELELKIKEIEKIKKSVFESENQIQNLNLEVEEINKKIQKETGIEQENINQEIANLRAEIAGLFVKIENSKSKIEKLTSEKISINQEIKKIEELIKDLREEPVTTNKKRQELEKKKLEMEKLESQIKRLYLLKSQINFLKEKIEDKKNLIKSYDLESISLIKKIETLSARLTDVKIDNKKTQNLKLEILEIKNSINAGLDKELEIEKIIHSKNLEIKNYEKILNDIEKIDICPLCKSKITKDHIENINKEIGPEVKRIKKEIENSEKELNYLKKSKEKLKEALDKKEKEFENAEHDLKIISEINEKKEKIKETNEKINSVRKEISNLLKKHSFLEKEIEKNSILEEKYDLLKIEIQEISFRNQENLDSEILFKRREIDRLKVFLNQILREEEEIKKDLSVIEKNFSEKNKELSEKRKKEEEISSKFKKLIEKKDEINRRIREKELKIISVKNEANIVEQKINELKIEKAKTDAELDALSTELLEFKDIEFLKATKESLLDRLKKTKEELSNIGAVNLRSIEVYDSIKREYESVKEKADTILKEKEGILKVIHEIDTKKKRVFLKTVNEINKIFSRNFSELSDKGQVFLELENKKDPFEPGYGIQVIIKTGHGRYLDIKSLSGGEKTLVALSLIFAIQEYKPYYFYLLDEIDAALDKRNSERLASLLNKYMQNGQYIIITHNDEIINRATNLYGLSMHEGISKIISLKV